MISSVLPILQTFLIVPLFTFAITYTVSYIIGDLEYPDYYLSSSIKTKPASCIGTFGLFITSALIPIVSLLHYQYVLQLADAPTDKIINRGRAIECNRKALIYACVSSLGSVGISSFQLGINTCDGSYGVNLTHIIFAQIFFIGGLLNSYYIHQTDEALPLDETSFGRTSRKIIFRFNICMIWRQVVILLGLWYYDDMFMFIASMSEISIFIGLLLMYATFYKEMYKMKFILRVERN
jgi:hypothetical protein